MLNRWLMALVAAVLAGCATAPKVQHAKLDIEAPATWHAGATVAGSDSTWWLHFDDSNLDSLIQEALRANFNLKIAEARLRAASAQARIAGAGQFPQLNGGGTAARRKQNFLGLPIPGSEDRVLSSTITTYGVSLDASWELDIWGRVRSAKSAALAEKQATQADLRGFRLSLVAQVSKAWFAAVEAQRQVELAAATAQSFRVASDQVQDRYERGLRPPLDLRLTRANAASAEAVLQQRRAQFDAVVRQLEIVLGRYPGAALRPGAELPPMPAEVPAGLPATIIARRPDVIAAERRLAASKKRVSEARAQLYPTIRLTGSGGTTTTELSDLLNGDFSVWSIAGSILQPLFQGGRLRANVELNKAVADQVLAQYALTALNAYGEVEGALATERFLREQEAALAEATEQAIAARQLAEEQYASGLINLITLLEAQRRAYSNESALLTIRRQRLDARIDLYLALGGGFEAETAFAAAERK